MEAGLNPEKSLARAKYGAEAFSGMEGALPTPFPRTIGPNAVKYLWEVVESGLASDMVRRFEEAFAEELMVFISGGISHAAFGGLGYLLGINPIWGAISFALASALVWVRWSRGRGCRRIRSYIILRIVGIVLVIALLTIHLSVVLDIASGATIILVSVASFLICSLKGWLRRRG